MNELGFEHIFQPGPGSELTLLLLHGTGGDETSLLPVARQLVPTANLLSVRGRVLENGAPRFFRRFEEGKLDIEDWRFRSEELAKFLRAAASKHGFSLQKLVAFGYSNGANIATGLLLNQPDTLTGAVLLRPMFVTDVNPPPDLKGKSVLICRGIQDPLETEGSIIRLKAQFEKAGALVSLHEEDSGHRVDFRDFQAARDWLEETL